MTPESHRKAKEIRKSIKDFKILSENCSRALIDITQKTGGSEKFIVDGAVLSHNNIILKEAIILQKKANERSLERLEKEFGAL